MLIFENVDKTEEIIEDLHGALFKGLCIRHCEDSQNQNRMQRRALCRRQQK